MTAALVFGLAGCGDDDDETGDETNGETGDETGDETGGETGGETGDATGGFDEPSEATLFERAVIASFEGEGVSFQRAKATFALPDTTFARVMLNVELESPCFPFEKWADDPPPTGQNWPPSCDAFDRNFEFTLDEPRGEGEAVAIELVRAITPFGGPMTFAVDVTDVFNATYLAEGAGEHTVDVQISTWSDGAGQVSGSAGRWFVSAKLSFEPGVAPRNAVAVIPLINGSLGADAATGERAFVLPEGARSAVIEYRVTGHGGADPSAGGDEEAARACIGGAEEFCRREHVLSLDGEVLTNGVLAARDGLWSEGAMGGVASDEGAMAVEHGDDGAFTPWRENCANVCTAYPLLPGGQRAYCKENPTGDVRSVNAPRANWCPGDVTAPFVFEVEQPTAGEHTLDYAIRKVQVGGSWRTSAHVIVYGE